MVVAYDLFFLVSGFAILIISGDKLVDRSVVIARRWNIPASVIAVTLIAAGTSAPELVTSFLAAYQKTTDISLGNVVGSNIFNILAIGGLSLLLKPGSRAEGAFFSWPVLLAASGAFAFFIADFYLTRGEGILLFIGMNAFIVLSFFRNSDEEIPISEKQNMLKVYLGAALSLLGLIVGAQMALTGGADLGRLAGLSERIIGITIISVGTGLPELATSIAAAVRGRSEMAAANIIGSNVFNTLGIPGVTAIGFPMAVSQEILTLDTGVMIAATAAIGIWFFVTNKNLQRLLGATFLSSYVLYICYLVFQA